MKPKWWPRRSGQLIPPPARLGAERLEDRCAPAVAVWDGGGADDAWSTAANWNVGGVDRVPLFNDDVVFDATSDDPARVDRDFVVNSVTVNPGYDGTVTVAASLVVPGNLTVNAGTVTHAGAVLSVGGDVAVTAGTLTHAGTDFVVTGNWTVAPGAAFNHTSAAPVTFNRDGGTQVVNSGGTNAAHDFAAVRQLGTGTLQLAGNDLAVTGRLELEGGVGGGGTFAAAGKAVTVGGLTVIRNGSTYLGDSATQTFNGGLALDLGTLSGDNLVVNGTVTAGADSTGTSAVAGNISLGGGVRTITVADGEDSLVLAATVGNGGVIKNGAGVLRLNGFSTYAGGTTVQAGTLLVAGVVTGPVTLAGGVLGGTGTVGPVTASGGTLAPGSGGPGTLGTADLTLAGGVTFAVELAGAAAGQFDRLNVAGTVALGGATLTVVTAGGFAPALGQRFVIVANDGADPAGGTFAGMAEGAQLTIAGQLYQVSYAGGDGNDVEITATSPPPPPDVPPTISDVGDQALTAGTPSAVLPFTIGDDVTPAAALAVTAASSNPTVVPAGNVVLGGSGADRTVTVTPAAGQAGTATITLTVTDAGGRTASDVFVVTVTDPPPPPPVNTPPRVSDVPNVSLSAGAAGAPIPFTVGDDQTPAAGLAVNVSSSNPGLVPVGNIVFAGAGADRTLTVTPAAGQAGTAVVTLTVTDPGGLSATDTFTVTVPASPPPPANTAPTIGDIGDRTTPAGQAVGPVGFAVGDAETPAGQLTLSAASGNPALVPAGNVAFGGSGANRTVTVTPLAGRSGTAVITVTVTDAGGLSAADTFTVTVPAPTSPPPPPGPLPVLVGVPQFAVGADRGRAATVRAFNPDGGNRFGADAFPGFAGGVRTAAADFNGDGVADVVVGTGPGRDTLVRVIDGKSQEDLFAVAPFEASFTGGVYVAAGDVTGDGTPEVVITPDEGGGPRVRVFDGNGFAQLADFFGIEDPNFRGGARAAVGDVNGDKTGDLVVAAGFGGGPRVAGFDGKSLGGGPVKVFGDFFAFEQTLRNGVFVAAGDVDGDGFAEVIAGGGPGGGPRVFALSGKGLVNGNRQVQLANFFGGDPASRGGIRVAVKNLDADARADVVVGAGAGGGSRVTAYAGKDIAPDGTPPELRAFDAFPGFAGGVFVG